MSSPVALLLSGIAGVALGAAFFGGLWWTVRKGLGARQPALWFLGSALLRMGIAVSGFYLVSGGHWDRLLACLSGFVIARLLLMRLAGPPPGQAAVRDEEAVNAP